MSPFFLCPIDSILDKLDRSVGRVFPFCPAFRGPGLSRRLSPAASHLSRRFEFRLRSPSPAAYPCEHHWTCETRPSALGVPLIRA